MCTILQTIMMVKSGKKSSFAFLEFSHSKDYLFSIAHVWVRKYVNPKEWRLANFFSRQYGNSMSIVYRKLFNYSANYYNPTQWDEMKGCHLQPKPRPLPQYLLFCHFLYDQFNLTALAYRKGNMADTSLTLLQPQFRCDVRWHKAVHSRLLIFC